LSEDHDDLMRALSRLIREAEAQGFYGEIVLVFKKGEMTVAKKTATMPTKLLLEQGGRTARKEVAGAGT
jgi:hypothetical protein